MLPAVVGVTPRGVSAPLALAVGSTSTPAAGARGTAARAATATCAGCRAGGRPPTDESTTHSVHVGIPSRTPRLHRRMHEVDATMRSNTRNT